MEHALLEADAPRTCIITGHCRARTVPSIKYYCSVASTAPRGRAQTIGLLLFWYPALTFPSSLAHANERGRETREASHGGAVSTCAACRWTDAIRRELQRRARAARLSSPWPTPGPSIPPNVVSLPNHHPLVDRANLCALRIQGQSACTVRVTDYSTSCHRM